MGNVFMEKSLAPRLGKVAAKLTGTYHRTAAARPPRALRRFLAHVFRLSSFFRSAYVSLCNQQVDEQIRTFSILFLNSRDRYPVPVIILRVSCPIQFLTFTRYIFYQSFFHIFSHLNSFQRLLDLFGHRIVSYLIF